MGRTASLVGVFALICVAARAAPDFPSGAEALEQRLLAGLDASSQAWIKDQARSSVSSGRISEDRARSLADGAHMASGADVNTVSFLLLMQALRDADADLQATMDRSQQDWANQDELSKMARNRAPTVSQLSPSSQTVLSMRGHTRPIWTLRSNDTGSPSVPTAVSSFNTPTADVDLSVRLDLQTAMDRENAADDAVTAAMKRVTASPSTAATTP